MLRLPACYFSSCSWCWNLNSEVKTIHCALCQLRKELRNRWLKVLMNRIARWEAAYMNLIHARKVVFKNTTTTTWNWSLRKQRRRCRFWLQECPLADYPSFEGNSSSRCSLSCFLLSGISQKYSVFFFSPCEFNNQCGCGWCMTYNVPVMFVIGTKGGNTIFDFSFSLPPLFWWYCQNDNWFELQAFWTPIRLQQKSSIFDQPVLLPVLLHLSDLTHSLLQICYSP